MSSDINIVKIKSSDLDKIVKIHIEAFPDFFLTFLGPRFLKEFYSSFVNNADSVGFAAVVDGDIVGAVVGPLLPQGYFKKLLIKRFWAFMFASISAVCKKPTVIKRLFRAIFYRGDAPSGMDRALLSSIAVSPVVQGKGVGKALINAWMNEVKDKGIAGCFLTTDADDNEAVNKFYEKTGWKLEVTYTTPEGRNMNRYIYDF